MATYNKTKIPPADCLIGQTPTGLKYWNRGVIDERPKFTMVETEDSDIYMVRFLGNMTHGNTFMFHYKGFRTGFLLFKMRHPGYGGESSPFHYDNSTGRYWQTIHDVGTPVVDSSRGQFQKMFPFKTKTSAPKGAKPFAPSHRSEPEFITGLTWEDFGKGLRTKFPSDAVRSEMLAIWLSLLNGFYEYLQEPGNKAIRDSKSSEPETWVDTEFSPEALKQLLSEEMIDV